MSKKSSTGKLQKELAFVEKCIIRTMRRFRENPEFFWSEEDVCCYLKGLLLKGRLFKRGRVANVFLSFSTRNTYMYHEDGALFKSREGKNGYFSLAGWASGIPTTRNHLTQQLSFAAGLKHFRQIPQDWAIQIRNELVKLTDEENAIPPNGRFLMLLTTQPTSPLREQLNALLAEFPSVRCYQQLSQ